MKVLLDNSCQRVCISTDTSTSSDMVSYMCVAAYFIDNIRIYRRKLLIFARLIAIKDKTWV